MVKWSNPCNEVVLLLFLGVVDIEKGAFWSPSTRVANCTYMFMFFSCVYMYMGIYSHLYIFSFFMHMYIYACLFIYIYIYIYIYMHLVPEVNRMQMFSAEMLQNLHEGIHVRRKHICMQYMGIKLKEILPIEFVWASRI